jgi:hypothetical protein
MAIAGPTKDIFRPVRLNVIRMNEIKIATLRYSLKQGVRLEALNLIPANMWNAQSRIIEFTDLPWYEIQALVDPKLIAFGKEQLESKA